MSFSVWYEKPPFDEASLTAGEKIYQVGDKWVVTDQGQPTQSQIDALTPSPNVAIDAKISALESAVMLPRVTREFMLATFVSLAAAQNVTEATLYASNVGYKRVKDFDSQIAALRAQRV